MRQAARRSEIPATIEDEIKIEECRLKLRDADSSIWRNQMSDPKTNLLQQWFEEAWNRGRWPAA
jgi:hypothetical protein